MEPNTIPDLEIAVEHSLGGGAPSAQEVRGWLSTDDSAFADALRVGAARVREALHGRVIRVFAPLYYSNRCVNNCLYCGFRRDNVDADRRVLTPEEIEIEASALLAQGHTRILLVASEDPSDGGRLLAIEAIRRVRAARFDGRGVEHIAMEVAPGEVDDFRALAGEGLDAYVLFQETYDREIYAAVHPDGRKRDFDWRYEAPLRAIEGGIPNVGLGVLLGLGDPVEETIGLIRHARDIGERCGRSPRTVSLPRIEPAEGSDLSRRPIHPVGDDEFLRLIAAVRIALPEVGIVISTREGPSIRDRALQWGVTEMSIGSRTDPGGYATCGDGSLEQFELQDKRGMDQMLPLLRSRGFEPYLSADPRHEDRSRIS